MKLDVQSLREEAERRFAEKEGSARNLSAVDALSLQHELGVHQIELELQNEDLRRTRDELEAAREKYFDLYDLAPVGYAVLNDVGLIQEANLTLASRLGVARTALIGRPLRRFLDPASQDLYLLHLRELFETAEPSSFEVGMVMEDGTPFQGRLDAVARDDSSGSRYGRVTLTDLTERKLAEIAIREAEGRFRLLAEATSEGVAMDDGKDILDCNVRFAAMHGYEMAEMIGMDIVGLIAPESIQYIADQIRSGRTDRFETTALRKDGSRFPVEGEKRMVSHQGTARWILALRDLTDQKRADAEIHQLTVELEHRVQVRTAELEAANKELDAFSHSVSHDLRAPLRAIEGFSAMVMRDHSQHLDPQGHRLLGIVRTNVRQMSDLVDALLGFSRASQAEMKCVPIDMTKMVKELLGEIVPDGQWNRFDVRVDDLPPATGDPELIRVVLQNLLSNAVKYSGKREHAVIEIGSRLGSDGPEYFVKDNGAGFDMTYASKLFGVFQRLHGVTEFEGTGIGLALVKRIVTRHGGAVWAEGEVGKGATFSFSLPARDRDLS